MMGFRMTWHGDDIVRGMEKQAAEALKEIGEDLKEKAVKLCPKKTGALSQSAVVEIDVKELTVGVVFKKPHAHLQHEKVQYKHKNGEQAKFLEQPLNENSFEYMRKLADAIGGEFRR